jgi:hypothetical protein
MATQYPLTIEQLRVMVRDLADMKTRADEMFNLMKAGCGETDQRTLRAEELTAAIQRLQWAIERTGDGNGAGPAR